MDGTVVVVVVTCGVVVVVVAGHSRGGRVVVVVTTAAAVKLSVRSAVAFSPAGTFTFWPSPILSTAIVLSCPSLVSTTVQVEPAGIP